MYAYANIGDLKGTAVLNIEGTVSDTRLRQLAEGVSREVANYSRRNFHPTQEVRYFDGSGKSYLNTKDLITLGSGSLTESTLLDGTWGKVWGASGTAWIGEPYNASPTSISNIDVGPYRFISVNEHSNNTDVDAFETGQRRFKLAGVWGWSNVSVDVGLQPSASWTDTATSLGLSGTSAQAGWTMTIGTEQMYVRTVVGTTITVDRGVNGFSAGTHHTTATLSRVEYPSPVREAVIMQSGRLLKRAQGGYVQETGIPEGGQLLPLMPEGLDRDVKQMLGPYRSRGAM